MVARGPGAVGCAHCTLIGAETPCPICTHLICERCAQSWTTCTAAAGRVLRLGLTARLRDVDPTGRLGLVSHWRQPLRLFDLRRLSWIKDLRLPRRHWLLARRYPPRLTADGKVIHAEWSYSTSETAPAFAGMRTEYLDDGARSFLIECDMPAHGTAVTPAGNIFYYVTETQRVGVIMPGATTAWHLDPLPRKVIHSAHIDGERMLLAAGSWEELTIHRIVDGALELGLHAKPETTGDVTWIAIAGPWLVAAVTLFGGSVRVEVRRLEQPDDPGAIGHRLTLGPVIHRHTGSTLRAASLSRDGRYLALALDRGLTVHELGTENRRFFDEHTDDINFVRFVGEDHLLASADTDNRVILRPRTPLGYAVPLVELTIPDAGVELPATPALKPE